MTFKHLDFSCHLDFDIWVCSGSGLVPALLIPRYIRHIDKRKLAVIINPSYFGKFLNLAIDKIDI